jgi:hypothetical protein
MSENNFDPVTGAPVGDAAGVTPTDPVIVPDQQNVPAPPNPAPASPQFGGAAGMAPPDPVTASAQQSVPPPPNPAPMYNPAPMPPQYGQQPGANPYMTVPPEIRKWNWGAFMFNMFWGIGNKSYLALLCLIPCFGWFVWPFVCGALGNQWAWKTGEFKDVEQFMAVQRTWNRAGFVCFIVTIAGIALYILGVAVLGVSLYNSMPDWAYNY